MQIRNSRMGVCGWLGGTKLNKVLMKHTCCVIWIKWSRKKSFILSGPRKILPQIAQGWDTTQRSQNKLLSFALNIYAFDTIFHCFWNFRINLYVKSWRLKCSYCSEWDSFQSPQCSNSCQDTSLLTHHLNPLCSQKNYWLLYLWFFSSSKIYLYAFKWNIEHWTGPKPSSIMQVISLVFV